MSFIKPFTHYSKENNVIATGSHDKSIKFWGLPAKWLEFRKKDKNAEMGDKKGEESNLAEVKTEKKIDDTEIKKDEAVEQIKKSEKKAETPIEEPENDDDLTQKKAKANAGKTDLFDSDKE